MMDSLTYNAAAAVPDAPLMPEVDVVVRLRGLRDELEAQLIGMGELDEDGARPRFSNHLAEDAQEQQQRASDAALRKALMADIRALDHAIQRGQQGMYGLCEDCGHEIPPRRLQVVPGTTLCVTCQSRRETSRTPM